jgi:hypothetical protein
MKRKLLFFVLVMAINHCFAQTTDCSQGNGTYKYRAKLTQNIPVDFNKNDFLDFIVGLDNISNQDLTTLTDGITAVYRSIPSINPHKLVTIDATVDIYSILDTLQNSLDIFFCVDRDCIQQDETYAYYVTLIEGPIANDFDKNDFIDYITARDVISSDDLAILSTEINTVEKAFPSAQSDFLKRTIIINVSVDIYGIMESLINSVEYFECIDDGVVLEIEEHQKTNTSIVFPNPITENSVVQLKMSSNTIKLELINALGQLVYSTITSGAETLAIKNIPVPTGISFLKIYNLTNGRIETLKVLKLK